MKGLQFKLINPLEYKEMVLNLLRQLNPKMDINSIENILIKRNETNGHNCFALFENNQLIGISSGYSIIRIYSGKQLELENVIIDSKIQSKGYGKYFINAIKKWSLNNNYRSIGLNAYVQNSRSHKFYLNEGFKVLGFHFVKNLGTDYV